MSAGKNKNSKTRVRKKQRVKAALIKNNAAILRRSIRKKKREKNNWLRNKDGQ